MNKKMSAEAHKDWEEKMSQPPVSRPVVFLYPFFSLRHRNK